MLDRKEIIKRAYHECMVEMYAKAQPSADYNQLLEDVKNGKIGKDERVYERYYLSQEEFKYILNKYKDAYNIKSHWKDDVEVIEKYIEEGGVKDKYIPSYEDENGNFHPGYRGYEDVAPLKDRLFDILEEYGLYDENMHNKLYDTVVDTIDTCKNFFKFDSEETSFDCSVALGPSPNSCAEAVIQYWAHQGVDIEIKERNPLLLWEMDEYGENFEEYMRDDYGEDWEEQWKEKWEEEKNSKK
jgi:hypothetical protein